MKKLLFVGLLIVSLAFGGTAVFSQSYNSPIATTNTASNIGNDYATLNGQVNPNGYQTTYYFEYGQTNSLGQITTPQNISAGYTNINVTYGISGLTSNSTYYFRIDATNTYGTIQGAILTFNTYGNSNISGLSINTNAATNISSNSATFGAFASVSETDQGLVWFEYGTDGKYFPNSTNPTVVPTASYYRTNGTSPIITSQVTNLNPNTNYYFRSVIRRGGNTSYGQTLMFSTYGSFNYVASYTNPYTYYNTGYIPPVTYNTTYTTPTPTYNTTYTPTPTYQYVYQQPKVVYVNPDGTPYTGQQSQSYSNISLASQQGNQYYAPYYGMQTIIPPSQNSGLSANIIGAAGSFSGSSLFGAVLFIMLIGLLITGILKEAF